MKIKVLAIISLGLLLLIVIYIQYGKDNPVDRIPGYTNSIFTNSLTEQIVSINCWFNDTPLVIKKDTDIKSVYRELASLKLRKALPFAPTKEGGILIELVTDEETISFVLLSGSLNFNHKLYYANKDVVSSIREIALKYQ